MSRVADEKRTRKQPKKPSNGQPGTPSLFVVYHPTTAEKEAIKAKELPEDECLAIIAPYLELGHRLIIGQRAENEAFFVHLRQGDADYDQAVTLSCFHGSISRCLQMLAHALQTTHEAFPEIQLTYVKSTPDW